MWRRGGRKSLYMLNSFVLVFDLGQFLANLYHGSFPSSLSLIHPHTCWPLSSQIAVPAFMSSTSGQRLRVFMMQRHVIAMTSYSALSHPPDITVCPPLPGPEREWCGWSILRLSTQASFILSTVLGYKSFFYHCPLPNEVSLIKAKICASL